MDLGLRTRGPGSSSSHVTKRAGTSEAARRTTRQRPAFRAEGRWKGRLTMVAASLSMSFSRSNPIAFCNQLLYSITDPILQPVFSGGLPGTRNPLWMPDKPDDGGAGRPVEPDHHPRHDVREPPPFPRAARQLDGGHRLEYPLRAAEA